MCISKKIKEHRKKKIRKKRRENALKLAKVSMIGTATGVIAGVLLARKSGKETINDIVSVASSTGKTVSEKSKELIDKTSSSILDTKSKITESKSRIKDYFKNKNSEVIDDVTDFIEESYEEIEEKVNSEI